MATVALLLASVLALSPTSQGELVVTVATSDSDCISLSSGSGLATPPPPLLSPPLGEDEVACLDINQAMGNLSSDSRLVLKRGTHRLDRPHVMSHMSNIALVGTHESDVRLTCDDDVGLGFFNVSGLTIANVTIHGCGLSGEGLEDVVGGLKQMVDVWTVVPPQIRVGLFFGHCSDLTLSHVTVNGTRGLGLLAINVVGSSVLREVEFTHNVRESCEASEPPTYPFEASTKVLAQIGGGAYFLYHDYLVESAYDGGDDSNNTLTIEDCYFAYNADCSFSALTHLNHKYFPEGSSTDLFTVGAGGGLSVIYAHSGYSMETSVRGTMFLRNDARYGAGAYVGTFSDFRYPNWVMFESCSFERNGLRSVTGEDANADFDADADADTNVGFDRAYCRSGGGLAILTDLFKLKRLDKPVSHIQNVSVSAYNTSFLYNEAEIEGGGLFAYSLVNSPHRVNSPHLPDYYSVEWILKSCTFDHNRARLNAAATFFQRIYHAVDGIVVLYLESVTFSKNDANKKNFDYNVVGEEVSTAVSIKNVLALFGGSSLFANNRVTALHVHSTLCIFLDNLEIVFERNTARRGGAMYIEGSSPAFFMRENVTMAFRENEALLEGGAVYVDNPLLIGGSLQPLDYYGCILHSLVPNVSLLDSGSRFEFSGNRAPVGSILFGLTLEACPWSLDMLPEGQPQLLLPYLYDNHNSTFVFDRRPVGKEQVSTGAARVNVSTPLELVPGETAIVNIDVHDNFNNRIFAVVTSGVRGSHARSELGESGFWYTAEENATVRLYGLQNSSIDVSYFTYLNFVGVTSTTNLLLCPAGFEYNNATAACVCAMDIFRDESQQAVSCDDSTISITTTLGYWVGTELDSVDSIELEDLILHECHFDYCEANSTFRPPDYDAQCRKGSHRTGVLCGACKPNFSVVFGTNECKMCSNYFLFMIPVFTLAGVLVFLAIAFLEFTVDKGCLNAVLFYSNIVSLYSFATFPDSDWLRLLLLPAHLLSLELGFSLCFFDGMTALTRAFIQFLFPLYLHLLMVLFGLLSRRYSLSCYFSPSKTFVTIVLLSYSSLLKTCIEALAGHTVYSIKDGRSVRWIIDSNQLYFRGWHAVLGVIALVVIIVYLIALTVIILLPPMAYKLLRSGKPFYDAIYAPFKQRFSCWVGLRLVMRALIIALAKFLVTSVSLVINLVLLISFLHIQVSVRPHKSKWLGIVDSYLMVNAIILYGGTLSEFEHASTLAVVYCCIFLVAANLVILAVFAYHIDSRFPKIREKFTKWIRGVLPRMGKKAAKVTVQEITLERGQVTSTSFTASQRPEVIRPTPSPQNPSPPPALCEVLQNDNTHYRDSILDTI